MLGILFLVVPLMTAIAFGIAGVRLIGKLRVFERFTARYSSAAVWFVVLAAIAIGGLLGGASWHFGLAAVNGDPCLSDWDYSCSTPWAERLSNLQLLSWPAMVIGQAAGLAAFGLGVYLAGRALLARAFSQANIHRGV